MRLTELAAQIAALIEEHGDIVIKTNDFDGDLTDCQPVEVYREFEGTIHNEADLASCRWFVLQDQDLQKMLDHQWAAISDVTRAGWDSREKFDRQLSEGRNRAIRMIEQWDTLPKIAVI